MESLKKGKGLRSLASRKSQGDFHLPDKNRSVVELIEQSNRGRIPELVPIRHQRMSASPFAFYRGTAGIMAMDIAHLPRTNIIVQAIGDCHLMNFGGYSTPEQILVFDANDFDETLPASWEWDLKRLATSFVLAARENGFRAADGETMAFVVAQAYRQQIWEYAGMSLMDRWYAKFDFETIRRKTKSGEVKHLLAHTMEKASRTDHDRVFYKITASHAGKFVINEQPPLIYHAIDVQKDHALIHSFIGQYMQTLQRDRRWLFGHYEVVDVAVKVVGVGSVGTHCYVVLLMNKQQEPLFLQVKEAGQSVLEPYAGESHFSHHGERVVEGQRLVQAASDIFLGWGTGPEGRHYYFRHLRDRKISPFPDKQDKTVLEAYARLCGRVLARAHARSGDPSLIAGYMGKSDVMERSIARFALAYADQTAKDYDAFMKAIRSGKLSTQEEQSGQHA